MIGEIVRGKLYYAELPGVGEKAVLVVSWNAINHGLCSPIVCQVTTTARPRNLPTHVPLPAGTAGAEHDSYVLCHELATLDAADFRRELGTLPAPLVVKVEAALRRALDLR